MDGRERPACALLAVLRRGVRVLYADCAVAGSGLGAERFSVGATAGSARGRATGDDARGVVARVAAVADGRNAVRRCGRLRGTGPRDLVGATVAVGGADSGSDGVAAQGLRVGGGEERVRGSHVRDGISGKRSALLATVLGMTFRNGYAAT